MKSILVIDNYDSFTYNLVHVLEALGDCEIVVKRNDSISLEAIHAYDKIILSPGPGLPKEAGFLMAVIEKYAESKPILGVCLGHQAIVESFGGELTNLDRVYHGVEGDMLRTDSLCPLMEGVPKQFRAGRYHSWVVDKNTFPAILQVTAVDNQDVIMAFRHRSLPIYGVQFHPESIMTPVGHLMLENFARM